MWILILFLGLIFGSLGSVIMTRFSDGITRPKLRGFFFGYSQCPQCTHRLKTKDLIPVVSYLVQGGKCRYCNKKIPRIYPVLELLCAGIFVGTYFLLNDLGTAMLVFGLLTNWLLVLLLVYDLKTYELHMLARILLVDVGILMNIFLPQGNIVYALLSALLFGGVFVGIYFFAMWYAKMRFKKTMEGFGQGDVYLAASIGLFIPILFSLQGILFSGWMLLNVLILFVLLSSILGLIGSGFHYLLHILGIGDLGLGKNKSLSSSLVPGYLSQQVIPFFPAMIVAFWLMAWKLNLFILIVFPLAG